MVTQRQPVVGPKYLRFFFASLIFTRNKRFLRRIEGKKRFGLFIHGAVMKRRGGSSQGQNNNFSI